MRSIDGATRAMKADVGTPRARPVLDPAVPASVDLPNRRDQFRAAVAALEPGPLRDVLMAVAYARDEAARTGTAAAPAGRWLAVVAAAERAAHAVVEDAAWPRRAAA
jgi:hypothetical protein